MAICAAILCLPFLRAVFSIRDEGILLNGAVSILDGRKLYLDFFEFLPPGGFLLTAGWFGLVGSSLWSARLLAISTVIGIACFTFLACRRSSRSAPLSAFLATWWVVMSQGGWVQVSHHWIATLFSMAAAWAALAGAECPRRLLRWPLIAGAAVGMAAMVIETRGVFAMLAALTAFWNPRQPRDLLSYLLGCALAPAGLLAYLAWTHTVVEAFEDVIRFTFERYSSI